MELDALKNEIKIHFENGRAMESLPFLQNTKFQKATDVINKIRKSVWLEMLFAIMASISFLYFSYYYSANTFRIYFSFFSCVSIAFALAMGVLLFKLHIINNTTFPIKKHITTTINIIRLYTKNYFIFCMVLLPVCICFAVIVFLLDLQSISPNESFFTPYMFFHVFLPLLIFYCLFSICMYFFTKFYLHKLYGEQLSSLQNTLQELDSD